GFAKGLAAVNLATGILEPALAGVVVATGALAGALVAGGAGLGAYGLVLGNVASEMKNYSKLQTAVVAGTKGAKGKMAEFLKTMSPAFIAFSKATDQAKASYVAWARGLEAPVLTPLTGALKLVRPALKQLTPLVRVASGAIAMLLRDLGQQVTGGGLERFVKTVLPLVRPTILNLGHAIGNLTSGIWGVLKAFLPVSNQITGGVLKLTEKFKEWGQSLPKHSGFQSLMQMFRTSTPKAVAVLKNLAEIIKNVAAATVGLATPANSQALLNILTPLTQIIAKLSKNQALVR